MKFETNVKAYYEGNELFAEKAEYLNLESIKMKHVTYGFLKCIIISSLVRHMVGPLKKGKLISSPIRHLVG